MALQTELITKDEVRKHSIAKANYDEGKFAPHILPAQEEFILPFLGEDLYTELQGEVEGEDVSESNETLLDKYIKPALAWFVLYKALPFIHSDIANVGVQANNTEHSNSASDKSRADLMKMCLDNGNTLLESCKRYLVNNEGTYPLYDNADDIETEQDIIGGIILDNDNE